MSKKFTDHVCKRWSLLPVGLQIQTLVVSQTPSLWFALLGLVSVLFWFCSNKECVCHHMLLQWHLVFKSCPWLVSHFKKWPVFFPECVKCSWNRIMFQLHREGHFSFNCKSAESKYYTVDVSSSFDKKLHLVQETASWTLAQYYTMAKDMFCVIFYMFLVLYIERQT